MSSPVGAPTHTAPAAPVRWAGICLLLTILAFAAAAIFLVWFSQNRLLALDEGFYVYASKLTLDGQTPTRDFFYPQTPLLPYVYAAWLGVWGVSWSAARAFSGVCAFLLAGLVYADVRVRNGAWLGLLALVLFVTSSLAFPWYTVVKSYPFAHLMLFLSWVLLRWPARSSRIVYAVAGASFALAIGCRSYLIGVAPIVVFMLLAGSASGRDRRRAGVAFLVGALVTLIPVLVIFAHDPAGFWFNNLGYHLGRYGYDSEHILDQKWNILRALFGVSPQRIYGRQFALLLWPVLGMALWDLIRRRRADINAAAVVFLLVASALPSPTYEQYFCVLVPFVVCAFCSLVARRRWPASRMVVVAAVFLAIYLWNVPRDVQRFLETGVDIPGMSGGEDAAEWRLDAVHRVAQAIDAVAAPGETVVALWPGYLLESHALSLPGAENHFSPQAAEMLAPPERARYHLLSYADILEALNTKQVRLLIARKKQRPLFAAQVPGLRLVDTVGSVEIYSTGE